MYLYFSASLKSSRSLWKYIPEDMKTKTIVSGAQIAQVTGINAAIVHCLGRNESWPGVPSQPRKKWKVPSSFAAQRFKVDEDKFVNFVLKGGAK